MKNLTIFCLFALSALSLADLSSTCTSGQLRTSLIPMGRIMRDLKLQNFERLSTDYDIFVDTVNTINTICTPVINKMMFQIRLDSVTCESRTEFVLTKLQEFEDLEVIDDSQLIRTSSFILTHIPQLLAICQPKPEVAVVEPVQVEEVAPVADQIENPIPYEGVSDDSSSVSVSEPEVAPQQQEAPQPAPQESSYDLTTAELKILSGILSHTPYGAQTELKKPEKAAPKRIGVTIPAKNENNAVTEAAPTAAPVQNQAAPRISSVFSKLVENIKKSVPVAESQPEPEAAPEVVPEVIEQEETFESPAANALTKLRDAIQKAHEEKVASVPTQSQEATRLPIRIGLQTGSKITRPSQEKPVEEVKKVNEDPKPECLATVYQTFSILYDFEADSIAHDIKSLEDDYKELESVTDAINSYCVPTINRDETFTGAGDCDNELTTINDIVKKFKKNDPTNYLNVVDTVQNLWTVHKAFENDCVKKSETVVVPAEPVQPVETVEEVVEPEAVAVPAPEDKCQLTYGDMIVQFVKMAEDADNENLSEILGDLNEVKKTIFNINRFCDNHLRINVFPQRQLEAGNCQEDFANMRTAFDNFRLHELEDLAELTQSVWNLGFRMLHDC